VRIGAAAIAPRPPSVTIGPIAVTAEARHLREQPMQPEVVVEVNGQQQRELTGYVGDARGSSLSTSSPRRPYLAFFAAVNALAAWGGAVALVAGGTDFGERTNERLPFDSLVLAGVALAVIVALPLTVLAWSAWTGAPRTYDVALISGVLIIGWIVVQVVVLRAFSMFQPLYLCVGACFIAAAHRVRLGSRRPRPG
jgi:hypothetical protein